MTSSSHLPCDTDNLPQIADALLFSLVFFPIPSLVVSFLLSLHFFLPMFRLSLSRCFIVYFSIAIYLSTSFR